MHLLSPQYLPAYRQQLPINLDDTVQALQKIDRVPASYTFYTSVAVMSSSRIEGEQLEVDSYLKHTMQGIEYLPELVEKPNDLFNAYLFAREQELNPENFLQSHVLLSRHLLPEHWRGVYRKQEMLVMEHGTGRVQFEAAPAAIVAAEMEKLWNDIITLLDNPLTTEEIFYYAAYIHLVFVSIHPFNDGNGRAGRLLEKWFLAQKLGDTAWYIPSEQYYYQHINTYYRNLNRLGIFYEQLDYSQCLPFLGMLVGSVG